MRKTIVTLIFLTILFLMPVTARGENIAGDSAAISYNTFSNPPINQIMDKQFIQKQAIRHVLERHGSPLVGEVDNFMNACTVYELDCYLLPSITALESTFGQFIWPGSYNPFGWGGGYITFKNWNEGINTVGSGLRNNYIDKGATTVDAIGRLYAESSTWSVRVQSYINEFRKEEDNLQLFLNKDKVKF